MKQFNRKHDVLFWFSKGEGWTFNNEKIRIPHKRLNTNRAGAMISSPLTEEGRREYLDRGKLPESWWPDFSPVGRIKRERTGYPTQKPLALLDRIIKASSNEGDMVLDPFAGCATACVAAFRNNRQWTGIDVSSKAYDLVRQRVSQQGTVRTDVTDHGNLLYNITQRTDVPQRTDLGRIPPYNAPENKTRLYGEQEGHCAGCGTHFEARHLVVDHIIARSVGGTDHLGNLQLLCHNCNSIKGNRGMEYLIARLGRG